MLKGVDGTDTLLPGSGESTMLEGTELFWENSQLRARSERWSQKAGISMLRELAPALEHWELAGTHPSLHERGSVFYGFKQCTG